jgi:hypothetical protein
MIVTPYKLAAGLLSLSVLGLASCQRLKTATAKISKPGDKNWLPPGMSRRGEEQPAKTPAK